MIKKAIYGTLMISWMVFIFIMSNQQAQASSNLSNEFISNTIINTYKLFDKNLTEEKKIELISTYSYPIRKLAHLTLYLILGILTFLFINSNGYTNKKSIIISLIICIIYACSDEIHQLFILNRFCEVKDVIIDTSGAIIGINMINYIKKRKK